MTGRWSVLAAIVAGPAMTLVAGPEAQRAQSLPTPQAQTFRAGTTLVPVDVRVLDRAGNPVTDLTANDFMVFENGMRQRVAHFSTQSLMPHEPGPNDALKARTSASADIAPQDRRVFLIVLGRGRLQPPSKGVDGMIHFVRERALPQDLVAVLAWNRATEFTTDHAKVADLLERFKRAHEGIESKLKQAFSGLAAVYGSKEIPAGVQRDVDAVFGGAAPALAVRSTQPSEGASASRLNRDRRELLDQLLEADNASGATATSVTFDEFVSADVQTMQDLGKLYAGIEYLRHFDGEKHLVFVSESGLVLPRAEDDRDLAGLATDARVAIDYVHTGGTPSALLNPNTSMFSAETSGVPGRGRVVAPRPPARGGAAARPIPLGWQMATARTIAELTGGRFFGTQNRDAATDMDFVDQGTRFQYILGYYPPNPTAEGRYRRITVRTNRPGLTVLYRHGYYGVGPVTPLDKRQMLTYSRIAAAATYPNPVPDVPLRATATGSTAPAASTVQLALTIDPSRLAFTKENGRNRDTLDLAIFCLDGRDVLVGETWKTIDLNYSDERLAAVIREGVPVTVTVDVTAPAKNVKAVLYDFGADLVGSVIVKVQ